jgi:hypothetical protein
MRHRLASAIALTALLACAGPLAAQNAAPQGQDNRQENRKSSATNNQEGPSNAPPTADQHRQGDQATHSTSGRGGKEEPGSHAPSQDTAVFVNGALNVPGAPADSQTVPAKFSKRNDALDKLPTMAFPLGLSDEERKRIADGVRAANAPVARIDPRITEELPLSVALQELPQGTAEIPGVNKLKYVRLENRILLVLPSNRIVVGEIKG